MMPPCCRNAVGGVLVLNPMSWWKAVHFKCCHLDPGGIWAGAPSAVNLCDLAGWLTQEVIGLTVGPGGATRHSWKLGCGVVTGLGQALDRYGAILWAAIAKQRPAALLAIRPGDAWGPAGADPAPRWTAREVDQHGPAWPESARSGGAWPGSPLPASCPRSLLERGLAAHARPNPVFDAWTPGPTAKARRSGLAGGSDPLRPLRRHGCKV